MRLPLLVWLAVAGLNSSPVIAVDFYVSPTGSDSNSGSSTNVPFRSIVRAQQAVRRQISASLTGNITVHLAPGIYPVSETLSFASQDSGRHGFTVNWSGPGAVISGGIPVTGWTQGSNGVWSASVPAGTRSRNLYVNGQAANFARRKLANRKDFDFTSSSMSWKSSQYDWLMDTAGIAGAEVRFINSFTDRWAPIQSVGNRQLVMRQYAWFNNMWGYDTNALALMSGGGQFYLDSTAGKVYYKPLASEDMHSVSAYLGVLECIVSVSGTYDDPAHDLTFHDISFAHSTWMTPATVGYVDQQTGVYIGENTTYTPSNFESTRPHWHQMPGAIQISAARNIVFSGGNYTQLGAGGFGIGNDANTHVSGTGLGASYITVADGYFTQAMGNSITVGGVQADAHHPRDMRMTNSYITVSGNIFYNTSALSTVPVLATYVQYSIISHNELHGTPYSGLCHGYGWGSNDAGGSPEYLKRGLYNFQPKYSTSTTSQNNLVDGNLIHGYGYSHTDLGAIYTLSKSPSTVFSNNYAYDSGAYGLYADEGSNSETFIDNLLLSTGTWLAQNGANTANNAFTGNYGRAGPSTIWGNALTDVPDGRVSLSGSSGGVLTATLSNYDDLPFTGVSFSVSASSVGVSFSAQSVPGSAAGNADTAAAWRASRGGQANVTVTVRYTNSRTGVVSTRSASGTVTKYPTSR
ncbi:pectin lyase [Staphylotrichum tortipilum]|uniref:Pectin lyase n=1 Tax=Staphylotrichum tortipilum TaxID=2831512 RepID=A0AAN6RNX7_9PEZI|nr:pectin lyase [Staphylotrichum longicolle]